MARILNEDERQFQLDIQDIIQEEMYQCLQKFYTDEEPKKDDEDQDNDHGGQEHDKEQQA